MFEAESLEQIQKDNFELLKAPIYIIDTSAKYIISILLKYL